MSNMNIDEYFEQRQTVRQYSDKPIAPELISHMIAAAANAPTTGGMQLYSVLVMTIL